MCKTGIVKLTLTHRPVYIKSLFCQASHHIPLLECSITALIMLNKFTILTTPSKLGPSFSKPLGSVNVLVCVQKDQVTIFILQDTCGIRYLWYIMPSLKIVSCLQCLKGNTYFLFHGEIICVNLRISWRKRQSPGEIPRERVKKNEMSLRKHGHVINCNISRL